MGERPDPKSVAWIEHVPFIPAITSRVSIARVLGPIAAWKTVQGRIFRHLFKRSDRPSMYDYDMVVIGSGPSGRRAAVQFAKLGRSVLVVEKGRRERGFYGRSYRVKQDIGATDLIARLQKTLDHEVEVLEHQFSRNMVKTASGEGRFL